MNWKTLVGGILLILGIGIAGFLYRSAQEQPKGPIACPADARVCPDGTNLGRTGPNCTFPECQPPNVTLGNVGLSFALPAGYSANPDVSSSDPSALGDYLKPTNDPAQEIIIRQFPLTASTTAADFIRQNAIMDPSGQPASPTAFSSVTIGTHRFSVVTLGRFEGVVDTVYYLSRENDVLRFDALSRSVTNWTDPSLDVLTLPANKDLKALLATLQGE